MRTGRNRFSLLALAVAVTLANGAAFAQQGPPPDGIDAMPPGVAVRSFGPDGAIGFVGFEEGLGGKVVTGAPFSATITTQTSQTLGDGNQIQRNTTASFSRDGQGRTRREMTLPAIGPWTASGKTPPHVVFINDSVAGKQYILDPDRKTARTISRPPRGQGRRNGRRYSTQASPTSDAPDAADRKNEVTTSLGTQTINGVSAEGTRSTRTIPAGAIGNEKPIVVTNERWYSSDLQMVVMSKRSDPRNGETVTQVTNIQRAEPDATLFQVPSDYAVSQGGPGGRKHFGRGAGQPPPPPAPGSQD
jgi:hypothetical protein